MPREMIIVPYDKSWKNQFENIKMILSKIFSDLAIDIQHFGSTSIIGMSAKPIIDVMVIVSDINRVDTLNGKMREAGYIPKGENGVPGRRYFQMLATDGINHTQHIHCYEKGNQHAINDLMFRDYLNIDREAFEMYKAIKEEASQKYRFSPLEYTDYKSECVNAIMKKAQHFFAK